jgi:hypothetical protein
MSCSSLASAELFGEVLVSSFQADDVLLNVYHCCTILTLNLFAAEDSTTRQRQNSYNTADTPIDPRFDLVIIYLHSLLQVLAAEVSLTQCYTTCESLTLSPSPSRADRWPCSNHVS